MAFALLAGLAGQVAMLPRLKGLEAQLEEREETAALVWELYEGAHCNLREAQIHLRQWVWRDWDWWPDGDPSGITCPWEQVGSPLLVAADPAEAEAPTTVAARGGRTLDAARVVDELGLSGARAGVPGDSNPAGSSRN